MDNEVNKILTNIMINLFLFKEMVCGSFRYPEIINFFLFSSFRPGVS